jgi:hypothetical protein
MIVAVPVSLNVSTLHLQSVQAVLPAAESVFDGHEAVHADVWSPKEEP